MRRFSPKMQKSDSFLIWEECCRCWSWERIRFLLSNPEKAEEIRRTGYERARHEHSWEMRFEKMFRLLGLI